MCEEPVGQEQKFKMLSNNETKILTTNENQFRITIKTLEENNIEYHRYQFKREKPLRVVLRGINHDSDLGLIKNELYNQGHEVINLTNIIIKIKSDPKNKNSEWIHINLSLFFVDLQPKENNKDIYNIKLLCHQVIKKAIEKAHPKQVTAVQRIQQKPAQPVTTNILYAQMASTSSDSRDNQSVPQMSIQ